MLPAPGSAECFAVFIPRMTRNILMLNERLRYLLPDTTE